MCPAGRIRFPSWRKTRREINRQPSADRSSSTETHKQTPQSVIRIEVFVLTPHSRISQTARIGEMLNVWNLWLFLAWRSGTSAALKENERYHGAPWPGRRGHMG